MLYAEFSQICLEVVHNFVIKGLMQAKIVLHIISIKPQ